MAKQKKCGKGNKYRQIRIINNPFVGMIMCCLLLAGVFIGFNEKNKSLETNNNLMREELRSLEKDYRRELANWNAIASEDALNNLLEKNDHGFDMIKEDEHPNVIYMNSNGQVKKVKSLSSIARINLKKSVGVAHSRY